MIRGVHRLAVCLLLLTAAASTSVRAEPPLPSDLEALDPLVSERIREVHRATRERSDSAAAWLGLAETYHAHELTDLAVRCYRQSIEIEPDNPRAWYLLALALDETGSPAPAMEAVVRAGELDVDYAPAYWRRGRWLLEAGELSPAEAAFQRSVQIDAEALAGWVGLAQVALRQGEAQAAAEILFRVLAADPQNGVAGQLLGTAFRALGDFEASRRALAMATGMGAYFPDPWQEEMLASAAGVGNRLRLLSARLERGQIEPVVAELEDLARRNPNDVGVLNKLSEGYLYQKRPEAAREVLDRALALDPTEFATLMHLSQAAQQQGDLSTALSWVERAITANPRHWQAYFEKASVLGRMQRFPDCLQALEMAMALGAHQNPNAWLMRGDVQLRVADWKGAAETFHQATERFPFLGTAFLGYGVALIELGELAEARSSLSEARALGAPASSLREVEAQLAAAERGGGSGW